MKKTAPLQFWNIQYKLFCTISNNIEVYEEPVPRIKKIPHRDRDPVKFEVSEKDRIVY